MFWNVKLLIIEVLNNQTRRDMGKTFLFGSQTRFLQIPLFEIAAVVAQLLASGR